MKFSVAVRVSILALLLAGCSATTLRCGTDGESSFVDLVNVPQDVSSQSRYFAELCSFSFEQDQQIARLNIIDGVD